VPDGPAVRRAASGGWLVERVAGGAGELHRHPVEARRTVRVHEVHGPALVLGSTQADDVAAARSGGDVEVARRRSGGGAVWLAPGEQVWVDVVVPAGDPLWDDDVGRAAHWLGDCWALVAGGGSQVWRGPLEGRAEGSVACFAGLGPGEVRRGGSKVVGISQRRTSRLARFQCVAYLRWDPTALLAALGPVAPGVRSRLAGAVAPIDDGSPGGVAEVGEWGVVERLLRALPAD
jgi:lipoate---protein ligase